MAGAAALMGAGIARLSGAKTAEAGHNTNIAYDSQTVMHLDVTNTTAGSSRISSNISGTAAAVVLNNYPVGISRPDGFLGRTMYTTSNCAGVAGACENATNGIGVMGTAKSTTGTGVYAFSGSVVPSTAAPARAGLYASGPNFGAIGIGRSPGAFGVSGSSDAGAGVLGASASGVGVAGSSAPSNGVYGKSSGPPASVFGDSSAGAGAGVRMYCMEGPESAFEDWGRAALSKGQATVKLDGDFAALITTDEYSVFPVPDGSFLTTLSPSPDARRQQQDGLRVRVIEYTIDDPARPRPDERYRLVTSLLDPTQAPAAQLALEYHERWEIGDHPGRGQGPPD